MDDNNANSSNSNIIPVIDDGELEFSNQELLSSANIGEMPSGSMDSFFDGLLNDTHACTHTHTCNPPGPDLSHTHTCFHVHTKILPPSSDEKCGNNEDFAESEEHKSRKRRKERGGNREAVRKYRQKKKAQAASLEDEVMKLKAVNQQLMKRLQGQAAMEAEISRLKCLLVDIRGRIEGEIGSFPYQRPNEEWGCVSKYGNSSFSGSYVIPCNAQCLDEINCLHPNIDGKDGDGGAVLNVQGFNGSEFENCMASLGSAPMDLYSCGTANGTTTGCSSGSARRKS